MSERAILIASMSFCILLIGVLAGRESCRMGWIEREACAWLTQPGVYLGPLLRF